MITSETTTQSLRVPAKELKIGDKLVPTNRVVTHSPYRGLRTPSGKVNLGLDGYRACFGARTMITIERAA